MSDSAPLRRIVCGLVAAAFMVSGASALSTVQPAPAWANSVHCDQVAYEPGPWGASARPLQKLPRRPGESRTAS